MNSSGQHNNGKQIAKSAILLIFFVIMLENQRIAAQTSLTTPLLVYEGLSHSLKWDADGSRFVFLDPLLISNEYPSVVLEDAAWVEYNVLTNTLSQSAVWPLQPQLSQTQIELLKPAFFEGHSSVMYTSPNKRYVVFAREYSADGYYPFRVTVADLEQNIVVETSLPLGNPIMVREYFDVYWSDDGTSFVVKSLLNFTSVITYFTDYEESLSEITSQAFSLNAGTRKFALIDHNQRVLDISPDGNQVLMVVLEEPVSNHGDAIWPTRLVVWNPQSPEDSIILDDIDLSTFGSRIFSSNRTLRMVTDQGLLTYDLLLRKSHVLDSTIKYDGSSFSPDGRHIILFESTDRVYKLMVASFQ